MRRVMTRQTRTEDPPIELMLEGFNHSIDVRDATMALIP